MTYAIVAKCAVILFRPVLDVPTVVWTASSAKSHHGQSKGMMTSPLNNFSDRRAMISFYLLCFIDTVIHLGNMSRKKRVLPLLIHLKR